MRTRAEALRSRAGFGEHEGRRLLRIKAETIWVPGQKILGSKAETGATIPAILDACATLNIKQVFK